MSERNFAEPVMDLLIRYDSEHPETLGEMAERRALYASRITEAVIRDTADMVMNSQDQVMIDQLADSHVRGYKDGIRRGLEIAQKLTGQDLSVAIAVAEDIDA